MNHYPHHIGDFRSGTFNMTRQERWIYRDLIDFYYDKEHPLPADIDAVCKEIGVRSQEERAMVVDVLHFKFRLTDRGYEHERCESTIAEYRAKAEVAKENGKLGGRPKKASRNPEKPSGFVPGSDSVSTANPVVTGSEANQEPITINQEPEEETTVVIQGSLPAETQHIASPAERSVEIAVYLRQRGIVGANSANPNISAWGDDIRVTNEILDASLSVVGARVAKGALKQMPGPNYLQPIIAQLLTPQANGPPGRMNAKDESRAAAAASIGLGAPSNDDKLTYIDGHIRQVD